MRMPLSSILLAAIVLGGLIAVFANAYYPLVEEREAKGRLANDARQILLPEITRNSDLLLSMQAGLKGSGMSVAKFDVSAWETISKGGLLLGLNPTEITGLLRVYNLEYQANEQSEKLLDAMIGMNSTLSNAGSTRAMLIRNFANTLNELQSALLDLVDRIRHLEPVLARPFR